MASSVWPATKSTACARSASMPRARRTAAGCARRATAQAMAPPVSSNHSASTAPSQKFRKPSTTPASNAAPSAAATGTSTRR